LKLGVRKTKFEGSRIKKICLVILKLKISLIDGLLIFVNFLATIKSTNAFSQTDKHKMIGYVKNWLQHAPATQQEPKRMLEEAKEINLKKIYIIYVCNYFFVQKATR
jgi:hypothetical protein